MCDDSEILYETEEHPMSEICHFPDHVLSFSYQTIIIYYDGVATMLPIDPLNP